MKLVEPLREFFKDEVRASGASSACPRASSAAIRSRARASPSACPGEITREKLDILRKADAIYLDEIRKAGLYDADLAGLRRAAAGAHGRRDGRRAHLRSRLRAARRDLGRRHDGGQLPFSHDFLSRTATRIVNEVKGVNRVVYDVTCKPPGTIEWE